MKVNALILLVAIALSGCTSLDHGRTSSLRPYLPGIQEFLQGYVNAESTNHLDFFFVSQVRKERGEPYAYAYWMTGNSIIILDLPIGKIENHFWYSYKARVDLATDLVPTPEDIGGSTYLVDAPWVENIMRDALQSGVKLVIRKKEANESGAGNGAIGVPFQIARSYRAVPDRERSTIKCDCAAP
jgi:hypothetical protein